MTARPLFTALLAIVLASCQHLTPKEAFCASQAGWHPDCNVE